jgi:hypothetical protein
MGFSKEQATFRIAIGRCSCREGKVPRSARAICTELMERIERLRALTPIQLAELPESDCEEARIDRKPVTITTYRRTLGDGRTIIVVQAFVRTLQWPTYFSTEGIGHILAEGLILEPGGQIKEAPENLIWAFR